MQKDGAAGRVSQSPLPHSTISFRSARQHCSGGHNGETGALMGAKLLPQGVVGAAVSSSRRADLKGQEVDGAG